MAESFSFEEAAKGLTLDVADRTRKPTVTAQDYGQVSIPDGSLLPTDHNLKSLFVEASKKHGVPLSALLAMAHQESTYNPSAVGPQTKWGHASGIMQYLDSTAKGMGIDPLDAGQSIDAAAKQMAGRLSKGLDWAIAAHHGGDNPRLHGKKTAAYTASILAKAAAIAKEMGDDTFELPPAKQEGPETFSFEDVVNGPAPDKVTVPGTNKVVSGDGGPLSGPLFPSSTDEAINRVKTGVDDYMEKYSPLAMAKGVGRAVKRGWQGIEEIINRDTVEVKLSDDELRAEWETARKSEGNDNFGFGVQTPKDFEEYKRLADISGGRNRRISAVPYAEEEQQWKDRIKDDPSQIDMVPQRFKHLIPEQPVKAGAGGFQQFFDTLKNPMDLLTRDSLPANFISYLANQPELERKKYDEARKVAMQIQITSNPDKFPSASVTEAQKAIDARRAKQDPGVREMWDNLTQAAEDSPAKFAGQLANSLMADPELFFAPVGIGAKPIQAAQAARGVTTASRAARIADAMLDAGSTAAAMNVGIGAAENLATSGSVNTEEVKMNAAMGFLIGGPMGAVFIKGAKARSADLAQSKVNGTYEQILKDRAAADVALEDVISGKEVPTRNAESINSMLGITSKSDRAKAVAQRRKEIKETFSNESDYADYLNYVADERMQRAQAYAKAAEERKTRLAAEADAARLSAQARRDVLQKEFDDAIAARNAKEFDSTFDEAVNENNAFETARKLNNDEYLEALFTSDDPTIRQTEAKIKRREAQLRRPKWQRGDADPVLLARVGIASTGAGLAYALSPDDHRLTNAVMVGLAGLLVPGPGRRGTTIPSRMRQAGMIDPEGNIIGMLVSKGKLANKLDVEQLKARDNSWVDMANNGNQHGYKQLYDTYFPDTKRYVNKFMRELQEKAGLDAEDVAQDAFIKAFQNIGTYSKDAPFGAWIKKIARNEALDAIDRMKAQKRGADYKIVGDDVPGVRDAYSGNEGTGSNVYEKGAGADMYDTPESAALYGEAADQMQRAFDKLSPEMKDAIVKSQLENYTDVEIAELTNTPLGTVQRRVQRAKEILQEAIKSEFAPKQSPIDRYKVLARNVESRTGQPSSGNTRLWRADKPGEIGRRYTNDLAGIALPFRESYQGRLAYVDVPTVDLSKYTMDGVVAKGAEFSIPQHLADSAKTYKGFAEGVKKSAATMDADAPSGWGGSDYQAGKIDPDVLKKMGMAAAGAALGWAMSEDSPVWGMGVGTVAGLLLAGKVGAGLVQGIDYGLGATSTRVMNHSPKVHRAVVNLFRRTMEETHGQFQKVDPFLSRLNKLPKDAQDVVSRALMTGDPVVIKKLLDHLGDPELINGYKQVRSVLDSMGDKLEAQSRFKRKDLKEYFPRIVKDKDGLFQAIDKKVATNIADAIKAAEVDSMRSRGRGLSQAEESALINQIMFVEKRTNQPGWTKDRKIEEITPELLPFYATPAESLHTYIRSAVEDIGRTNFFGKSKVEQVKGEQRFLDVDKSINNLLADEIKAGMPDENANELAKLLKSTLVTGDQAPAWIVREAKNLASAGLLGNFWSAATQLGDVVMQVYTQDMRATLDSVIRQATGKKFVDMKEYGLVDTITAEFATQSKSANYVNKIFKATLFTGVDEFGKNTALNAAISRAQRLAESPSGQLKLADKYAASFGDDFPKLVSELKSGKVSELTKEYAFLELSRSQPVTKFEMPQWWLDSPNVGRSALVLKSFMLKQFDLARRDGIGLMKQGKIGQGAMKLTELGIMMGLAGTASDLIKQFMTNGVNALTGQESKDIKVDAMDIPLNAIKTFGFNAYTRDRIFGVSKKEAAERRASGQKSAREIKPEPHKAIPEMFVPPFKMWTDIATQDPAMYRYLIPGVGPYVSEKMREYEAEEKKAKQKGGGSL